MQQVLANKCVKF